MESLATRTVQVRPVKPGDLAAITRLEESVFKDPYPAYFLSQLAEANPDTFLVALDNSVVVGYAVVDEWSDQQHLVSIAVLAGHRKKGIGQALLDRLLVKLREGRLGLELRRSNKEALSFYLKNGFLQTGVAHSYYTDGEDAIQMEKPITRQVELVTPT